MINCFADSLIKTKCVKCPAVVQVGDGNPLRRWRVSVEVEAPPSVVLNRVLRERHLWDVDLLQWRVCEVLDKQTELFQYVLNRMPPHPSRDFVVLRYMTSHIICVVLPLTLQQWNSMNFLGNKCKYIKMIGEQFFS